MCQYISLQLMQFCLLITISQKWFLDWELYLFSVVDHICTWIRTIANVLHSRHLHFGPECKCECKSDFSSCVCLFISFFISKLLYKLVWRLSIYWNYHCSFCWFAYGLETENETGWRNWYGFHSGLCSNFICRFHIKYPRSSPRATSAGNRFLQSSISLSNNYWCSIEELREIIKIYTESSNFPKYCNFPNTSPPPPPNIIRPLPQWPTCQLHLQTLKACLYVIR